jgi:hypothetical protein
MNDEDQLRRVLATEASKVEVSVDALAEIRRRIAGRRPWWQSGRFAVFSGAFAVAAVAAVAVGVVSCEPNPTGAPPRPGSGSTAPARPSPSAPPSSPAPVGPPESPGAADAPVAGTGTTTIPLYYVGTDRQLGPRLYREFHRISTPSGAVAPRTEAAVTEMLAGTAKDPDYTTAWPRGTRLNEVKVGDVVTVDLTVPGTAPRDAKTARIAVQQLVWTVTAVTGRPGVRLLLDGRAAERLWDMVPVSGVLRRAPALDTLGLVWLISPQDGDRFGRRVQFHVYGSVFEATVHVRVRQGNRTVSDEVFTLTAGAPAFGEVKGLIVLPPGRYTIEAYEVSMRDGSVQHLDDHDVTVG